MYGQFCYARAAEALGLVAVVATLSKGYDLDYIWKQVDCGPAKDAASYYIQASESGGEPPGRWWRPGARALGFEPGQTAERKRELRLEAVKKARQSPLFFDLTVSLSKSISIFHASLGENARLARQAGDRDGDAYWSTLVAEVDDMIWQAVHAGFGYFQPEAGYTRTGSHNTRVHGRETGQWREADLAIAHWLQHTSRDGDMQLHVHSQIAHVAKKTRWISRSCTRGGRTSSRARSASRWHRSRRRCGTAAARARARAARAIPARPSASSS